MAQPHAGSGKGQRPSQLLGFGEAVREVGGKVEYQSRNTKADAIHITSRSRRASVNCKRRRVGSRPTWRSWRSYYVTLERRAVSQNQELDQRLLQQLQRDVDCNGQAKAE